MEIKYICEFCGASYKYKEDAFDCEKQHLKPVEIEGVMYDRASCIPDMAVKFPKRITVKFDNGDVAGYRLE